MNRKTRLGLGEHGQLAAVGVLTRHAPKSYNFLGHQQHGMMCRHFRRLGTMGELFYCCGFIYIIFTYATEIPVYS